MNPKSCEALLLCLRSVLRSRAPSLSARLLRALAGMNDPRKAALYLGTRVRSLPPETIAAVLQGFFDGVERREPGSDLAVEALLCEEMRSAWPEGLSLQVQACARRERDFDLAGMLLELPEMDSRFMPAVSRLPKDLQEVPLGVRKAWARQGDVFLMDRLLSDPDPAVVANLLDNPRLMPRDVIRLASRTDAGEEVLLLVATHRRWISRYPVKVTLAHNPSTPMRITLGLLHLLMSPDLRELVAVGRVSGVVAGRAKELLRVRDGRAG